MYKVSRSSHNPLITPIRLHGWEEVSTCNGCPIVIDGDVHVLYRAISKPDRIEATDLHISTIGHTVLADGVHPSDRKQLIVPEHDFEKYGCEDPRITKLDDTYYIFYTALSSYPLRPESIKLAVAVSKDLKTFEKYPVTPFNSKAMALFPKRVNGKMTAILTVDTDEAHSHIGIAQFDDLSEMTDEAFWHSWYKNIEDHSLKNLTRNPKEHVEVGAPPVLTDKGWLVIYSHIQNFFEGARVFGIEALLLDKNNPLKIIGRTKGPIMVPGETYEKYGLVPDVTFPTGALIYEDTLDIYYGATDTTTCRASVKLDDLLDSMLPGEKNKPVQRFESNPILKENELHSWEALDVFNPGALDLNGSVHIVYRAMSKDNTSVFGYARSEDGVNIVERDSEPMYVPRADFEQKKSGPNGYSGCEDPRLTVVGDRVYMFYTAYDGVEPPKIASSNISIEDFCDKKWENWTMPQILTPGGLDDKDGCLLSHKIDNKFAIIHRVSNHICLDYLDSLDFSQNTVMRCIEVLEPRRGMWDSQKVGIGGPPILTDDGWLMLYHGVSDDSVYRVGAVLLERDDPTTVIARLADPIFEPKKDYEMKGQIANVVFPCGNIVRDDTIFLYYGAADSVVGVATLSLSRILDALRG